MPLLVDEAHYVAGGENVVDQIATHRAAGLEPAFGLQYFAQLGSASEHQQKILKGVLNLLQSRFLFRMGDAEDAEQATRIAMAVYSTMIRDDPDSRARLRVTPEQALNFPNYYCLASWIADGTRAPELHRPDLPAARRRRRVGRAAPRRARRSASAPTPSSSNRRSTTDRDPGSRDGAAPDARHDAGTAIAPTAEDAREPATPPSRRRRRPPTPAPGSAAPKRRGAGRLRAARRAATDLADSPVRRDRRTPGTRARDPREHDGRRRTACASSRSSTASTRSAPPTSSTAPTACRASTTRTTRSSRCSTAPGSRPRSLIGRAALPGRAPRTVDRPPRSSSTATG